MKLRYLRALKKAAEFFMAVAILALALSLVALQLHCQWVKQQTLPVRLDFPDSLVGSWTQPDSAYINFDLGQLRRAAFHQGRSHSAGTWFITRSPLQRKNGSVVYGPKFCIGPSLDKVDCWDYKQRGDTLWLGWLRYTRRRP